MPRDWREEYNGGIYHVIARGNNKEYIFKESIDKGYFIKLLKDNRGAMGYVVYGYVLMDNHYHLIIQTMDKKLQEIMHLLNNKYSKLFNTKYNRVGHVFQGRYKAILVQDERYILKLLRYVHQNPVRAGICKRAEQYKWSSDIYYRKSIRGFVNTEIVLRMLDKDADAAVNKYKGYMQEEEASNFSNMKAIGEEAYQVLCESRKQIIQRVRLDEILIGTGVSLEDAKLIKSGSRKRALTEYKLKYAIAAIENNYSMNEIGRFIGMTAPGIKDMLNRYGIT